MPAFQAIFHRHHFMRSCGLLLITMVFACGCKPWALGTWEPPESRANPTPRLSALGVSARVRPQPSHDRVWRQNLMVLPYAEIESDKVLLRNIRDCHYRTEDDYDVRHFDRVVRLDDLQSLDFIVVPFQATPSLAHTMLSFGLSDGQYLVFSVEARLEQNESYHPVEGAINGYELMWVVGTERDLIGLRTEVRKADVYLYRTRATPQQVRKIFLAAVARVNQIARQPEFYDTIRNNCTTNIVALANQLQPGTIPEDIRVLLPGHSDKLLYDQGLLAVNGPFPIIKEASRINPMAKIHHGSADFSQAIRGQLPTN